MASLADLKDRVTAASAQGARYAGGEARPLRGYAATMTVYATVVGALAGLARATRREIPERW